MLKRLLVAAGTYLLLKDHLIPLTIIVVEGVDSVLEKVGVKLADTSRQVGNILREREQKK